MAHFAYTYRYVDQDARSRVREEHLAYLRGLADQGSLVLAGPWADDEGALVVYRAESEAAAQALVDGDPFTREGVTADRSLREWKVAVPPQ